MSPPIYFLLLLLATSLPLILSSSSSPSLSAYQVLQSYDFPVGLLPKGVTSYKLDPSTGKFAVHLNNSCSFTIDGYELKYKATVTGTISRHKIKDLKGIQVKVLFFWLNIVEVTRDGDEIDFSVGIASASFSVENFYESPQCGCGFDCGKSVAGGRLINSRLRRIIPRLFQI